MKKHVSHTGRFRIHQLPTLMLFLFVFSVVLPVGTPIVAKEKQSDSQRLKALRNDQLVDSLLEQVGQKFKQMKSLEIDFEQNKNLKLMLQPLNSTGVLLFKLPDSFLWRFSNPDPTVMTLRGDKLVIHYPSLKQADILDVQEYKDRIGNYLEMTDSMHKLKRYYTIRIPEEGKEAYYLELTPKRRRIREKIDLLEIWISRETLLPVKIHYTEPNGDSTMVKITKFVINPEIDSKAFEYVLPEETKLNYPMKGKKPRIKADEE
jgi:outer membrane lipoprotein-sorting protein